MNTSHSNTKLKNLLGNHTEWENSESNHNFHMQKRNDGIIRNTYHLYRCDTRVIKNMAVCLVKGAELCVSSVSRGSCDECKEAELRAIYGVSGERGVTCVTRGSG